MLYARIKFRYSIFFGKSKAENQGKNTTSKKKDQNNNSS
jgi:hypothetical protein